MAENDTAPFINVMVDRYRVDGSVEGVTVYATRGKNSSGVYWDVEVSGPFFTPKKGILPDAGDPGVVVDQLGQLAAEADHVAKRGKELEGAQERLRAVILSMREGA